MVTGESKSCGEDKVRSRFLLTFDDGPSVSPVANPTVSILEQLAKNSVQDNVRAIMFVQTRNSNGGGSDYGRRLLRREYEEGHVIGLHSGTARGHVSHTRMGSRELQESLLDGMSDIQEITGQKPIFVRPPFWWFNAGTLAQYESTGLNMMLSDVKALDGAVWGGYFSFQRWSTIRCQLRRVRWKIDMGGLSTVDGVVPIIVTLHDTNHCTAGHLDEYLQTLVEEADRMGLPLSEKLFYDNKDDIEHAALQRAVHSRYAQMPCHLPVTAS